MCALWCTSALHPYCLAVNMRNCLFQGVTHLSVQSSVSLQHLPVDAAAEAGNLPPALLGRLSFATQKLGEIVRAARAAQAEGFGSDKGAEVVAPGAPALCTKDCSLSRSVHRNSSRCQYCVRDV